MKLIEWLWGFLPDTCEVDDCCRKGVRGNENRIYPFGDLPEFYIVVCDYCNSKYMHGEVLKIDGLLPRIIAGKRSPIVDFRTKRKEKIIDRTNKRQAESR